MQDVEEQWNPPERQKRRQPGRNALLSIPLIEPFVEPSQQQQRRTQGHQKELQRWRVLLDIKEKNHRLFDGGLNMPRTLRNPQAGRRISIQIGQAQQNKRNRQPKPDLRNQLSTAIFFEQINRAKNVACRHHSNPGHQRKQNKLSQPKRQQNAPSNMQDRPQPCP